MNCHFHVEDEKKKKKQKSFLIMTRFVQKQVFFSVSRLFISTLLSNTSHESGHTTAEIIKDGETRTRTVLVFATLKTKDKLLAKWAGTRMLRRDILYQTET